FVLTLVPPSRSTLFPYTTLFRSPGVGRYAARGDASIRQRFDQRNERKVRHFQAAEEFVYGHGMTNVFGVDHAEALGGDTVAEQADRKSTRLNSSHVKISYAVFCL